MGNISISNLFALLQVRIDDTTVVLNATFQGSVVRRLGFYGFDAGTVWYDEVSVSLYRSVPKFWTH